MSETPPRARRLASPSWLDGRLVAGVLLVLVAVVVGARVFASADHDTGVYVARHALVPGEQLTAADLTVGRVRFAGQGSSYVAAAARAPVGYLVTRYVGAGELLPIAALSSAPDRLATSRYVTMPVEPGHLPDDLGHGDVVDVYLTPRTAAGASPARPALVLAAVPVEADDGGSRGLSGTATEAVVLTVPAAQVPDAVHAADGGTIDLVRVPAAAVAGISPAAPGAAAPGPASPSPVGSATAAP